MLKLGKSRVVDLSELKLVTPKYTKTASYTPITHFEVQSVVKYALSNSGYSVTKEIHALYPDNNKYFGLFTLSIGDANKEYFIGLRNSTDKTLSASIVLGTCVLVCDNMAMYSRGNLSSKASAKHSTYGINTLSKRVFDSVKGIKTAVQEIEAQEFCLKTTVVGFKAGLDRALMMLYRANAITLQEIPLVQHEYKRPDGPGGFSSVNADFGLPSAYRLLQAITEAQKKRLTLWHAPARHEKMNKTMLTVCAEMSNIVPCHSTNSSQLSLVETLQRSP